MGSPTQTQIQNQTDRIAALLALNLAGHDTELSGATVASLGTLVDGVGDLDYEAAMLTYALAVDRHSLPENYATALQGLCNRPAHKAFVQQLAAYVTGAPGGSYASFRAYLTDKSAVVHPLFAELFRQHNREDAFTLSSDVTTVFAPNYAVRAADRVYVGADGSLAEDTTDALDVGTADVDLFTSDDHCLYIGSRYKFTQAILGLSTLANTSITPTFQYWNGTAWVTLTVTDNSTGLTKNDTITWTAPSDWQRCAAGADSTAFADLTPLYYVRISRTENTVATPPVATCLRIVPAAVMNGTGSGAQHLGVDQPPLGIIRITGAATIVPASIVDLAYSRFKEPALRFRALTPGLGTPTITASYVNQDGTNQTQAQSALTSPAALDAISIALNGADTGGRSVRTSGWVVSGGAQGVLAVESVLARTPAL